MPPGRRATRFAPSAAIALLVLAGASGCVRKGVDWYFIPPQLRNATSGISNGLERIDGAVREAAAALAGQSLDSPSAQQRVDALAADPFILSATIADAMGIVTAIAPEQFKGKVGVAVAGQPYMKALAETGQPVLSAVEPTLQSGAYGVALRWPILDAAGQVAGSIGVTIRYALLLDGALAPLFGDPEDDLWVMQTDGLLLYDRDPTERGRNLLRDDLYRSFPDMVAVAGQIVKNPRGRGQYRFLSTGHVSIRNKNCFWDTVRLHDTEWRVVNTHDLD